MNSHLPVHYQTRALRLRPPMPADADWLERQVETAADLGFNTLIVDAFFCGFTCFPSTVAKQFGFPRLDSHFRKIDHMEVAAHAAIRNGLRFTAAIDCLKTGPRNSFPSSPLLQRKFREWRIAGTPGMFGRHRDCDDSSILLCPANLDVIDFLGSLAAELADAYPLDGLMLTGLQFGPEAGSFTGRCFCDNCSASQQPANGETPKTWDEYRMDRVSSLISAIKARARISRRTLRLWGEFPTLPGTSETQEFVAREFDQELFDVDIVRMRPDPADDLPPSMGFELALLPTPNSNTSLPIESALESYPLGYICECTGRETLDPQSLTFPHTTDAIPPDHEPLSAAMQWLSVAANDSPTSESKCAEQCLALLKIAPHDDALVDKLHALIEPVLPQEGNPEVVHHSKAPLSRAFALLRLSIMMRAD